MWFKKKIKEIEKKESRTLITRIGTGGVVWSGDNYTNFINETFLKNIIAFKAVDKVCDACMGVNWKVYKKEKNEMKEVLNEPINQLFNKANPNQSFKQFIYAVSAYYKLTGNSYIEKVMPETGSNKDIPKELYSLRSDMMTIETDKTTGKQNNYIFDNKVKFPIDPITGKSDILHIKKFHPTDDIYGLSEIKPASREIDTSNASIEWNMRLLQNEARPGMLLMFNGALTDVQYDRLEKSITSMRAGGENAGKTLILEADGGISDAKPYSWSPKDLDFIEGGRDTARKICLGFGVPPQLLGIPGDNTYSNYKEARLSFYEDTVIPCLTMFRDELNSFLFKDTRMNNYYIDFDMESIPAISEKRQELWQKLEMINYLTINEKRKMVGFGVIEGGDVLYVSSANIPVGDDYLTETDQSSSDNE